MGAGLAGMLHAQNGMQGVGLASCISGWGWLPALVAAWTGSGCCCISGWGWLAALVGGAGLLH